MHSIASKRGLPGLIDKSHANQGVLIYLSIQEGALLKPPDTCSTMQGKDHLSEVSMRGTWQWMSPELLLQNGPIGTPCDVYSLGMVTPCGSGFGGFVTSRPLACVRSSGARAEMDLGPMQKGSGTWSMIETLQC